MSLVRLTVDRDYQIPAGEPDLCGYVVSTDTGDRIGDVRDAVADATAMKVRYLILSIDKEFIHERYDRQVIVPLDLFGIDKAAGMVVCATCNAPSLARFPTISAETLPADIEERIRAVRVAEGLESERRAA